MKVTQAWKKLKKKLRYKRGLSLASMFVIAACLLSAEAQAGLLTPSMTDGGQERLVFICNDQVVMLASEIIPEPGCRQDAFFGLTRTGELALYAGEPALGHVVLRFFYMDELKMKADVPTEARLQLERGLPVKDQAEYDSVLSTYTKYIKD